MNGFNQNQPELALKQSLCIQVQLDKAPSLDMARVRLLGANFADQSDLACQFNFVEDEDNESYINLFFESEDVQALWGRLYTTLYQDEVIGRDMLSSSIAMCEGMHGWDDYLLLQHFDPTEPLDNLGTYHE